MLDITHGSTTFPTEFPNSSFIGLSFFQIMNVIFERYWNLFLKIYTIYGLRDSVVNTTIFSYYIIKYKSCYYKIIEN